MNTLYVDGYYHVKKHFNNRDKEEKRRRLNEVNIRKRVENIVSKERKNMSKGGNISRNREKR